MLQTFDPSDEETKCQFVCDNMLKPIQMSLATVGQDLQPRNVCVNIDIDKDFNFFWKSRTTSRHSEHIAYNPQVWALVYWVYGVYDFGLYATGTVRTIENEEELYPLLQIKYINKGKPARSSEDFLWDIPKRIYLCELNDVYICDLEHKKTHVDLWRLRDMRRKS